LKEIQILEADEETDSFTQISQLGKPVNTLPSTSSLLTNASGKFGNHANAKNFTRLKIVLQTRVYAFSVRAITALTSVL
jgi:hypothetical protein